MDPKTLKKHRTVVKAHEANIVVTGKRQRTETGYVIEGYKGTSLETKYEVFLPGSAGPLFRHPKKDKVVRVLAGSGFVTLQQKDGTALDKRIYPGEEIVLKGGIAYRFCTTSNASLEIFSAQEGKYEARLEVLEPATAKVDVSSDLLKGISEEERKDIFSVQPTRRGSRAAEQQASMAGQRSVPSQVQKHDTEPDSVTKVVEGVVNVRPSHGKFSEEGAG